MFKHYFNIDQLNKNQFKNIINFKIINYFFSNNTNTKKTHFFKKLKNLVMNTRFFFVIFKIFSNWLAFNLVTIIGFFIMIEF